jgi:hypothetical protein
MPISLKNQGPSAIKEHASSMPFTPPALMNNAQGAIEIVVIGNQAIAMQCPVTTSTQAGG